MAFTDLEIQEIKHWLGYSDLTALARPYFDIAQVFEVVVQENINTFGEGYIRNTLLPRITKVDTDIFKSRSRFKLDTLGDLKLRDNELSKLISLKEYLLNELSKALRVPRAQPATGIGSNLEVY